MSAGLEEPTPKSQYTLYEMVEDAHPVLGAFDSLTGGDQVISMVKYNVMDDHGNVTTKFIPGQTTFEPVQLLRAMDAVAEKVYLKFADAVAGKLKPLKRNYSVSMNDSNATPLVWWHLYNALPTKVSGFDFNMTTENEYTSFEISLQAESIVIEFSPEATAEAIAAAIDYWTKKESGEAEEEPEEEAEGTEE